MAKFFENGVEKRSNDVYYGLKKFQWKLTMDSRDPVVVFFEKKRNPEYYAFAEMGLTDALP